MTITGANIKRLIEEGAFKQSAIAVRAGFSPKMFNDMIHGRKIIQDKHIPPIANALGVDANELFKELPSGEIDKPA